MEKNRSATTAQGSAAQSGGRAQDEANGEARARSCRSRPRIACGHCGSVASPVASMLVKATPLPTATASRKDGRNVATSPLPNASVPKQAPTITPSTPPPPVKAKAVPSPVATVVPSATVPTDKPIRNGPNPPFQKRVFASPAPPAKRPAPPVTPPPVNKPAATSSPAERIKAVPKSQPSATGSPGEDGKGPTEKE